MKLNDGKCQFSGYSFSVFSFFILLLTACNPSIQPSSELTPLPEISGEAISFLGDTLQRPEMDVQVFLRMDSLLEDAKVTFMEDSTDLKAIIWYGRRLAYMHKYKEAIHIYSQGISHHPQSPELLRHRGHCYITIRQPDYAIRDLESASILAEHRKPEIEPDGIPNKLDIPLSNLHFNIYYHLGLAYFLKADYPKAITAYLSCMRYADNPDLKVATSYWLYLSYLRSGDKIAGDKLLGSIHADLEIIENDGYLHQLLIYKGEENPPLLSAHSPSPDEVVNQYGISCRHDLNNRASAASSIRRIILSSGLWPSFGYIAAEADSARLLIQ